MPDPTPTRWRGWFRAPGSAWGPVCESATEADAWRRLLDVLAELGGRGGESCVLPAPPMPTGGPRLPTSVPGAAREGRMRTSW